MVREVRHGREMHPLILTLMPLEDLLKRLFGMIF